MANLMDNSLPFGIDFVIEQDLANTPEYRAYRTVGNSYDINCPFCGGKRKMNINTAKNLARCNKCSGTSGYNAITLHAALTNLSNKEAYSDLMKRWNGLGSNIRVSYKHREVLNEEQNHPCQIEVRNIVYRALLKELPLSKPHHDDLISRGLSEEQIVNGMYKSVPSVALHTLALKAVYETKAINMLKEDKTQGIPGFACIFDIDKICLRPRKNGYFVPVLDKEGRISGMQIRYDNLDENATTEEKESYKKYSWYSSSETKEGCSVTGCENIHFAGDWKTVPKSVCLTEGVLKADVASFLSKRPFLGLVGVNNIKQLNDTLYSLSSEGLENVNLYIDMDKKEKKEVADALIGIKKEINKLGKHEYVPTSPKYSFATVLNGEEKQIEILAEEQYPKTCMIFLEKTRIPETEFTIKGSVLRISEKYLRVIRNDIHQLHIVKVDNKFATFASMTQDQKKELLKDNLFCSIEFKKTGLAYKEINWDTNFKGIDDYYLFCCKNGVMV